ncbi:MAG TPA: hypothetical protein VG387_19030 [Rhizomicrobium sp.]|jgi:hypothetical protein|nr:hypothetical protein [Rhizomicrobium sp.]
MSNTDPSSPPVRLVARLVLRFMVASFAALARWHDGDLVRGIVFLAAAQASRPQHARLERPIRVYGLAASLLLPYETARRHVNGLTKAGLVVRLEDQTILVPEKVQREGDFARYADTVHAELIELLRGARAVGLDLETFSRTAPAPSEEPAVFESPDRAARNLVLDFMLRLVECGLPAHENDMLRALIFAAIMSANAGAYTDGPDKAWDYYSQDHRLPEQMRKPVSISEISARLGIPYETARRYVRTMLAEKDIIKVPGKGLVNPTVGPRDALLVTSGGLMMTRFVQLVGDLRRIGFDFTTLTMLARRAA